MHAIVHFGHFYRSSSHRWLCALSLQTRAPDIQQVARPSFPTNQTRANRNVPSTWARVIASEEDRQKAGAGGQAAWATCGGHKLRSENDFARHSSSLCSCERRPSERAGNNLRCLIARASNQARSIYPKLASSLPMFVVGSCWLACVMI